MTYDGIVLRRVECPDCGEEFFAHAMAADVDVLVEVETMDNRGIEHTLEVGDSVEFRHDDPSIMRVSVEERDRVDETEEAPDP